MKKITLVVLLALIFVGCGTQDQDNHLGVTGCYDNGFEIDSSVDPLIQIFVENRLTVDIEPEDRNISEYFIGLQELELVEVPKGCVPGGQIFEVDPLKMDLTCTGPVQFEVLITGLQPSIFAAKKECGTLYKVPLEEE